MFKNFLIVTSTVCFFFSSGSAFAQDIKIGIVNLAKVYENSTAYKQFNSDLMKKNEELSKKHSVENERIYKEHDELESKKKILSKNQFDIKHKAWYANASSFQNAVNIDQAALNKAYTDGTKQFQEKSINVINAIAKKHNYELVLQKDVILYNQDSLDITDSVLDELNKSFPSMKFDFEKAKSEIKNMKDSENVRHKGEGLRNNKKNKN